MITFTLIGIVVVILSIIAFFKDEDWLLGLVIFFSTFTAAAALKGTSAMTPFKIPLYLWLIRQGINFIKFIPKLNIEIIKKTLKENKIFTALLIFSITIILSVVWLFVSGINHVYYDTLTMQDEVITFSSVNVSQARGILIYFVFLMILSLRVNSKEKIRKFLNIFGLSTVFAIIWGFIQFVLYYLDIEYPAFLFNNNNNYVQCYEQVMHGIKRICSISTEPSVFSLNLLGFLPVVLIPWILKKEVFSKNSRNILTVVLISTIVCAILTTSSTSIIGLTVIMGIVLIYMCVLAKKHKENTELRKNLIRIILYSIVSIFIAALICILGNQLNHYIPDQNNTEENKTSIEQKDEADLVETIKEMTILKLSSDSGQERMSREILGMEIFIKSPVFGVGLGSFRTFTLFTNILINMGILGLVAYMYILFIVLKTVIKNREKDQMYALIFSLSILGMTVAFAISIPDLIYIYYWMILVFAYKYFTLEDEAKYIKNGREKMRIGIEARSLGKNKAGIGTYVEQIIKKLNEEENPKNEYILYSNRDVYLDIELKKHITIKTHKRPLGVFWTYFDLPKILKQDGIDAFWGPQHLLPKRNKYSKDIKFILTVHDLAIHKLKNIGEWKNKLIQEMFFKRSCKNADIIMADSNATKEDLKEIFKINENKIKVVYLGTNFSGEYSLKEDEEKEILQKFNVKDKNYLLFVSTIEPRKNIITLIKAYEKLREENKDNKLKLILAGGLGWKYEEILETINSSKYKDDINLAGFISKQEKECLLHNAKCFVYPSLYEGFGLPILEAMANEAIVVTSNISSIPEVGGDAALYFDDVINFKELASVIEKALKLSQEEKSEIIKKGKTQTNKFTWEKCAKEVIEILKMD